MVIIIMVASDAINFVTMGGTDEAFQGVGCISDKTENPPKDVLEKIVQLENHAKWPEDSPG